ncbi:thioredoxin domain-containing protein [Halolamina sp. CBA1230]|uniref:thioredoxin domain-containing protein n=1 Tax=Halolamina sp. CBA1230 TaxID=1853690 RepID=UPI0009A15336|nr:thioredoxin domain-containing protein [Halolamina sp. CBA1230]QKY19404.1 thioredoxin domain-containing protein [Halolamina sp. CBA1230]
MTEPVSGRNRLDEEASPYLQQHADNPVNWQPWDESALEEARERDVPIFLSVGYSACHWCHVMAEESFEDEQVAEVLNEEFVPIKVDREERPDLDRVYQTVCQLVTGGGGWPLSAFLTPEGKPFYVGTYFPPEPQPGRNVPGFEQLCRQIADSWSDPEQRGEMENRAEQWTSAARDRMEPAESPDGESAPPSTDILDDAAAAAIRGADRQHGGFGQGGPKFPHPGRVELLLRVASLSDDPEPLTVAENALNAMGSGGLYDHLGGGFHRYCVDEDWTVPHFEKMAYDNATIPAAFLAGYSATGRERYADVVGETLDFVERELSHPEGGFFSTLDARSETPEARLDEGEDPDREEGAFYVWTPAEVRDLLDEPAATLFCRRYGVVAGGNFEGGTSVLNETVPVAELVGAEIEVAGETVEAPDDADEIHDLLADARERLFAAREERPRPPRDEKVLAGWNGLLIETFARSGFVLDDDARIERARSALSFVREQLWDADEGHLSRRFKDGQVGIDGALEDYAFLGRGAFELYQATGDVAPLAFALDLAEAISESFYDPEDGTLYLASSESEELVARPQELTDQSTPSSVGAAVSLLLDLDHFTDEDLGSVARETLATHRGRIEASPVEHGTLAMAADTAERGSLELTVAAEELPDEWRGTLADHYLPGAVVARRPPTEAGLQDWLDELGLDEAPPIWADREARDGEPTVYACRSFTCSPPETDLATALDWVEENL